MSRPIVMGFNVKALREGIDAMSRMGVAADEAARGMQAFARAQETFGRRLAARIKAERSGARREQP